MLQDFSSISEHFGTLCIKQLMFSQPAFTCSKLRIKTLEQGVKDVQS